MRPKWGRNGILNDSDLHTCLGAVSVAVGATGVVHCACDPVWLTAIGSELLRHHNCTSVLSYLDAARTESSTSLS